MAYDASNNSSNPNVAPSTPLVSGTNTTQNTQNQPQNQPQGQAAPSQPMANQNASGGQKKASSGMFTNIQKYISANQPQAQKMAQAATQGVQKETSAIGQQVAKQQAQQQQALQANQQKQQQAMQFAQQQVQNIMGTGQPAQQPAGNQTPNAPAQETAQQPVQPSQSDVEQFQKYMAGDAGFGNVGNLDLSAQQSKMAGLQNIAGRVGEESGRRDLLKQTFGNRDYTRGQSGLDQLIVSGDKSAREAMIQGTQGAVKDTSKQLREASTQSMQDLEADRAMRQALGQDVANVALGGQGTITSELQSQLDAEKARRAELGSAYESQAAAVKALQDKYKKLTPEQAYQALLEGGVRRGFNRITGYDHEGSGSITDPVRATAITQSLEDAIKSGNKKAFDDFMIKSNTKGRIGDVIDTLVSDRDAELLGINKKDLEKYIPSLRDKGSLKSGAAFSDILEGLNKGIDKLKKTDYGQVFGRKLGVNTAQELFNTEGMTQEQVANQAQADRYKALQALMGKSGGLFSGSAPVGSAMEQSKAIEKALKKQEKLAKKSGIINNSNIGNKIKSDSIDMGNLVNNATKKIPK